MCGLIDRVAWGLPSFRWHNGWQCRLPDDVPAFAAVSGDTNPAQLDAEYANDTLFHGVIAHWLEGQSVSGPKVKKGRELARATSPLSGYTAAQIRSLHRRVSVLFLFQWPQQDQCWRGIGQCLLEIEQAIEADYLR